MKGYSVAVGFILLLPFHSVAQVSMTPDGLQDHTHVSSIKTEKRSLSLLKNDNWMKLWATWLKNNC